MKFTDIFIRRPVLAIVVSMALLVLGLRSFGALPIFQFPRTQNAVITVSTTYFGADPDLVAGFITTPLENAIAQVNGIDYMTSSSTNSSSVITANLKLNYDSDKALTEMNTQITSVLNALPPQTQKPVLTISIGQTIDAMYIGFYSDVLPPNYITDYLLRVVQPKLQAVEGVQTAELLGAKNFALRAWLDPKKLAAYGLTPNDVANALAQNDFLAGVGNTKGLMVQTNLNASTSLHSVEEFRNLIIRQSGNAMVRLEDVANVTLGAENYESQVAFDGKSAVYIGIQVAPAANLLSVTKGVRAALPEIQAQLPQGVQGRIVYDSTKFVNSSIREVVKTLLEALLVITLVVFAFLGSPRAVMIPVIAIPLSLIGTFTMMLIFGFSINLLTLLAFVLAIGLVVDDAIIVVENVHRHIESGAKPMEAAMLAARELAAPIIAMTIVLISVYVPIGFQAGLTGALFTEFAFTLVGTVTMSAVVALTLSPMMCSRLLRPHHGGEASLESRVVRSIDAGFDRIRGVYLRTLHSSLDFLPVTGVFAVIVLGSIYFLYASAKHELAPQEDQGVIIAYLTPAPNATIDQQILYAQQNYRIYAAHPETDHVFQFALPGRMFAGMVLKPWDEREKTTNELQPVIQQELNHIAGAQVAAFQPPSLPGARGLPVQFVIGTTEPFSRLNDVTQEFLQQAQKSGLFMFLNSDLRIDLPQSTIEIDRDKAALLGLSMQEIGNVLATMLGGGYVNYFSLSGRSYKVIPQVQQRYRLNTSQLLDYYVRAANGTSVPLSSVVRITNQTAPEALNHFQQLNAATLQGVTVPGVTTGDALGYLKDLAGRTLPRGYSIDYGGLSRQFVQESSGFGSMFAFSMVIIYLALAAQFESFRDPFIILVSVPMSIAGALVFIALGMGGASLNIYTQVGLVTLMGLVSKHGILIVQFANNLRSEGKDKREAIETAASIRLRPILMTTAAMVLGVIPLLGASGAGAASRFNMGLVIASGLAIGTFFTLLVVPAVYLLVAGERMKPLAGEQGEEPPTGAAP